MELWFSKTSLLGVVLTSAFTSALVIPRGHHDSVPASDVYKGGDQNHYPSESHGSGYSYPTTMARSSDIGLQTSSTPCATSSTATVTVVGSSIASLALQTGRYPISDGYPTNPSPSPIVLSSTMIRPTEPTVPPPEIPAISGYSSITPITSISVSHVGGHGPVVSSTFNTPIPYPSNYATVSVAPYPTASLTLQGAQVSHNTYATGTTPTAYIPISTGYTRSPAHGTEYMPHSNATTYAMESSIYISNTLDSTVYPATSTPAGSSTVEVYDPSPPLPSVPGTMNIQYTSSNAAPTPSPISAVLSSPSTTPGTMITSAVPLPTTPDVVATPAQSTGEYGIAPNGVAYMSA
ncbi:hypothetical protein AA0116_g2027 [Alternaria tenuissima]|nr:hypothetical protein AA0116_g2027 [Alternaria tenuissima]